MNEQHQDTCRDTKIKIIIIIIAWPVLLLSVCVWSKVCETGEEEDWSCSAGSGPSSYHILQNITPKSAGYRDNNVNKLQHKGIIENMYGKKQHKIHNGLKDKNLGAWLYLLGSSDRL